MAELTNEQIEEVMRLAESAVSDMRDWEGPHAAQLRRRAEFTAAALRELLAARDTIKRLEGLEANRRVITSDLRANRGDAAAFEEAVNRLRRTYHKLIHAGVSITTDLHLVLLVHQNPLAGDGEDVEIEAVKGTP